MKSKIYKSTLFVILAVLAFNMQGFAQEIPVAPPQPPAVKERPALPPSFVVPKSMDKELAKKMAELNVKMHDLQKQMNALNKEQMDLAMKGFNKKFDNEFKDFGKNFSGSFKGMIPAGELEKNLSAIHPVIPPSLGFKDFDKKFQDDLDKKIKTGEVTELTKNYNKSYTVGANDKLQIDNRYGKVTVNTWAKNEFKVSVQMKVAANEAADAKKILDNLSISDSKEGSTVSFKTHINNNDNNDWGSWINGRKNSMRKIEVNYVIYMPAKNSLEITNRYGSTELPNFEGKVVINSSYGSFSAKSLSNADNDIRVKYGSANIENLTSSDLNVAYGSLVLGSADKLNATISYGSAKITRIKISGNITAKYCGNLQIEDVDKNLKSLSVNSAYSSVRLGLSGDENADFDVTVHNGNFSYGDHTVSITSQTPPDNERGWSPTKNYKGHVGKGSSEKTININTRYGNVKFE